MPASAERLIGISEVGHVDAGPTDVSWGNTQEEGVTLQLSGETVDLRSGQATMKEDVHLVATDMSLVIRLVGAELQLLQRAWGLPDSAFAGDLEGGTPSAETLTIGTGNFGTQERKLYVEGPGPSSTRRLEAARCRVSDVSGLDFSSRAYQTPVVTWEILNPLSGSPVVITDAV